MIQRACVFVCIYIFWFILQFSAIQLPMLIYIYIYVQQPQRIREPQLTAHTRYCLHYKMTCGTAVLLTTSKPYPSLLNSINSIICQINSLSNTKYKIFPHTPSLCRLRCLQHRHSNHNTVKPAELYISFVYYKNIQGFNTLNK